MSAEKPDSGILADPKWHDMPKSASILTLSWEDIVTQAEKQNITLSRDQVVEIFQRLEQCFPTEPVIDAYWIAMESELEDWL